MLDDTAFFIINDTLIHTTCLSHKRLFMNASKLSENAAIVYLTSWHTLIIRRKTIIFITLNCGRIMNDSTCAPFL